MKSFSNTFSNLFNRPKHNYKVIDGIRAIAILWVILFHVWLFQLSMYPNATHGIFNNPVFIWITRGDLGVDLFFVISGFLIGTILFKEFKKNTALNFKKFYIRRFFRLIPVYVFSMFIGIYFLKGTGIDNWQTAWTNLLYINNYVPGSYLPWTWSLAIEEQFYIIIPFLIAFILPLFKRKRILFSILAITPIALTYYYSVNIFDFTIPFKSTYPDENWLNWFWNYYVLTHLRYGGLLAGIIAAYLNVYYGNRVLNFFNTKRSLNNFFIITSITIFISISSISLGQWTDLENSLFHNLPAKVGIWYEVLHREVFYYVIAYLIMACIYSNSILIKPLNNFLSLKFFYPIAQISYSAYLFHEMFMFWYFPKAAVYFTDSKFSDLQIIIFNGLVSLVAILIGATLMYLFIEQPFQRLRNKLTLQPQT